MSIILKTAVFQKKHGFGACFSFVRFFWEKRDEEVRIPMRCVYAAYAVWYRICMDHQRCEKGAKSSVFREYGSKLRVSSGDSPGDYQDKNSCA